ncbi:MAG: ribosome maturation factor RimM [Limnohabitans sp.]|nr:ribosome maturation factor RimM [Limnohabitans sp.]
MLALEPAVLPADAIEVGRIADAWGVKGWFKVVSHSASPEALFSSKKWYLMPTERGAPAFEGSVLMRIRQSKRHSDTVVAWAEGFDDRTSAESLKGSRIHVARSSFPSTQVDEYYWVDLLGLQVFNREGLNLGEVKDLMSTGPQTVLVLSDELEGKPMERLIPFVNAYIDRVDLEKKRIDVDWQGDY